MCSNVGAKGIRQAGIVLYVTFGIAVLMLVTSGVGAVPLSDFYPFNISAGDRTTDRSDDGGSGEISIRTGFPFFNRSHDKIFVNNNGIISFLGELKTYRPENFPLDSDTPVIAPFWADVDVGIGGEVFYRESTDPDILEAATVEIRKYFQALRKFRATWVFIATWDNVGFYGAADEGKNKRNTFQAVLIKGNLQSFVIFNYNKIQWTTGSNSGGHTTTGLGGNPAQAGFNAGDGKTFEEIPGARKNDVLNLTLTSNVEVPGKWVFRVDSATIQGSCSKSGSGNLAVIPPSGHVLGGRRILLYGPCFYKGDKLVARFNEVNVTFPCWFGSTVHAECVTPTIFRTGPLTVSLSIDDSGWNYTGTYTTINIAQIVPSVTRVDPKRWFVNQSVNITWVSNLIPSKTATVELLEYKELNGVPALRRVMNYTDVNQSSRSLFHFKLQNISTAAIIKVTSQTNETNESEVSIWSDVFPATWTSESRSAEWCRAWLEKEEGLGLNLTQREPCPYTRGQADGDTGRYQPDPFCNQRSKVATEKSCLYRGGATDCIISNYQGSSEGSQVCCYGEDGELLHARDGNGGGTVGRYHYRSQSDDAVAFFSYFNEDVLPFFHCCHYADKNNLCLQFLKYRPAVTSDGYRPPAAAQAAGDPHLVTLDGKGYTFNGEGDFVLMEDSNNSVVVQVRAERARDIEGNLQNATLFTAVAMTVRNVTDILEVRLDKEDIVQFLVNGRPRDLSSSTSEISGITVIRNNTGNSTAEVTVVLGSTGISVLIQATQDLLNIMATVGSPTLTGKLRGLLGNYNGNPADDLVSRNGSLLVNASMNAIHYDFGMTWEVRVEENILTPAVPLPNDHEEDTPLVPVFIDTVGVDLRNGTEEVCGDNKQCIFDYQVTGNEDIAKSTKDFNQRFEERRKDIQPVIRCPYLDPITNGNRTLSGLSNGSRATFVCNEGFELKFGDAVLVCQSDGKWRGTVPSCVKKTVVPGGGSSNQTFIYIGAGAGAGVVVLIVVVAVFVCRCRSPKKKKQSSEEGSVKEDIELPNIYFPPSSHIPTTVFENEFFLQSLHKLADSGSFRIPRPTYVDPLIYEEYF